MKKFAADYAFTLDGSLKPLERPLVVTDDDGKILSVSQYSQEELSGADYRKGILIPGMVNAHCHIELSHLKGVFRQATGMSGFINQINALRESVDEKGRLAAMEAEFGSFFRQGIVAVSDISNCNESFHLKKAYRDKVYYRTFVELFGTEKEEAKGILEGGQRIADQATAMGLDASVTPHSCYTMSPKLLEITAKRGLESGIISYHSQESQEEEDMIMKGSGALADNYRERGLSTPPVTGTTALEYFIDRIAEKEKVKGRINLVHNVVISQRSIDRALEALENPFFSICPLSNIFIHRQLPPIDLMRRNGLRICLGTDSLSSNLILDMVREMECLQENFPHLELGEILSWACTNGALLLGKEDTIGSLTEGKTPGIVLLENEEGYRINENRKSTRLI